MASEPRFEHRAARRREEARPEPARPAPRVAPEPATLQRLVGNRAVRNLLQSDLQVTGADHHFEHDAARTEALAMRGPGRQAPAGTSAPVVRRASRLAGGGGAPLDAALRGRLEPSLGSLSGVRVHRDASADAMTEALGAQALTHGSDIFVSRAFDRPGTPAGDRLLAHEAAHATGAAAASGMVHLKRVKKHLDFIKIKKKSTHITRMLTSMALEKLGFTEAAIKVNTDSEGDEIDHYGHWWIEYGGLSTPGDLSSWKPTGSYGWWPAQGVNIAQTLKIDRVEGVLNKGADKDPHEGDKAEIEYHPVLEVDDKESYEDVRDRVDQALESFAHGFSGSWNWRLAWGKNCHTFVDRAKKKLNLHHQKSKQWLTGGGIAKKGPPPKSFAQISKSWDILRGMGYGAFGYLGAVRANITGEELLSLTPPQRRELLSVLNEGIDDTNFQYLKDSEFGPKLAEEWGDDALQDYLA